MKKIVGAVVLTALPFTSACTGNYSIADVEGLLDQRKLSHFTLSYGGEYFDGTYNSREKLIDLQGTKTRITNMGPEFGDDGYDYFGRVGEEHAGIAESITQIQRDEYMNILQGLGRKLRYRLWFMLP